MGSGFQNRFLGFTSCGLPVGHRVVAWAVVCVGFMGMGLVGVGCGMCVFGWWVSWVVGQLGFVCDVGCVGWNYGCGLLWWLCGFDVVREEEKKREKREMERRERIDLFILFVGIIYIILISFM